MRVGTLLLGIKNDPPREVVGTAAIVNPTGVAMKLFESIGFRVEIEPVDHPAGRVAKKAATDSTGRRNTAGDPRSWRGKAKILRGRANTLAETRTFVRWCRARGWIESDTLLDGIEVLGKRRRGKSQLTEDESRSFLAAAWKLGIGGDAGGTAAATALLLGMRASEMRSGSFGISTVTTEFWRSQRRRRLREFGGFECRRCSNRSCRLWRAGRGQAIGSSGPAPTGTGC